MVSEGKGEDKGKVERKRGARPQPSRGTREGNRWIARRSTGRWLARGRAGGGAGWGGGRADCPECVVGDVRLRGANGTGELKRPRSPGHT